MARKNIIGALAGAAGVLLVAGAAGPGAAAVTMEDSGDVQVTVRKTVLQTASAEGEVLTSRMYTQVSSVGNGTKTVLVPVGTTSNRNLNEFGPFPMEGESIQFDLTVDGGDEQRTLTDAEINPMEVSVTVLLDGVEIQPDDVVGASGVLDVAYTVRNTSATTEAVTFTDVEGNEITEDVETADPYVGSLDVTLPKGFNEVTAPGATIAGNGQNQTSLGYSFVLFPPLGATEATVGYQARITNGVMPPADFSFLPIVPFDNSTIAGTAEAYKGGAAVGAQIFGAGQEIGENLLKLQDGAGQLVAGLGQLSAGAVQISDGLVNTAAPGAAALAEGSALVSDGLGDLNAQIPALAQGTSDLDDGANLVSDGLNQLNSQVPGLEDGADQLNDGAQQLSGGLDQLNAQVPALESGAEQLNDGAQQVSAGAGDLATGMAALNDGLNLLSEGVATLPENAVVKGGVKQLQDALAGVQQAIGSPDDPFVPAPETLNGAINALEFGLNNAACDPADPQNARNPCGFKQVLQILDEQLDNDDPAAPGAKQALEKILGVLGTTPAGASPSLPLGGFVTATQNLFGTLGCTRDGTSPTGGFCSAIADPAQSAATFATLGFYLQALGSTGTPADTVLYGLNSILGQIGSPTTPDTALYAINGLIAGIGAKSDFPGTPGTLYYGLEGIRAGLSNPACDTANPTDPANPCGIKQVQGLVSQGIDELVQGISAALLQSIGTSPAATNCDPTKSLTCASAALTAGSAALATGASDLADGTEALNDQLPALAAGVDQLATGAGDLADGTEALNEQVPTLAAGVDQLAAGGDALADGTGELNSKVPALADGVEQLDEGAATVAEGNQTLADGLGDAADGSEQLVDGLASAEPGGAQLEQGAGDLKEQGSDELAKTGKEAQLGYAVDVAQLEAAQQAGLEGAGIPYGEATGTDTSTTAAVQMQLAGIAPETDDDALKIGLGILLIAAAGGAAFFATRKASA